MPSEPTTDIVSAAVHLARQVQNKADRVTQLRTVGWVLEAFDAICEAQRAGGGLFVQSKVKSNTLEPTVTFTFAGGGDPAGKVSTERVFDLDVACARQLAQNILECSEAAEMDSCVVQFLDEKVGVKTGESMIVLNEFRDFRRRRGTSE